MAEYRVKLTLQEPVFCGHTPAVSNEMKSLDYIPATSLRGALAGALRRQGRGAEIPAWFSGDGPRWSAVYPLNKDGLPCIPTPLVLVQEKRGRPFQGGTQIWNTLHGIPPHTDFQWTRLGERWLWLKGGTVEGRHKVKMASSMHVGLHYGRQAHRDNALFSRHEISAGQVFTAYVSDPAGVLGEWPKEIFLGKRRSAGNGGIRVEATDGKPDWSGTSAIAGGSGVAVQLMTDAIVRERRSGAYWRGMEEAAWSEVLGMAVKVKGASGMRTISGWCGEWGLPREQATAIAAGSTWTLEPGPGVSAVAVGEALRQVAETGLGERRHEGFGWLAVDPAWLRTPVIQPAKEAEEDVKLAGCAPWPDLPKEIRHRQSGILEAAAAVAGKVKPVTAGKVEQLAHHAARSQSTAEVLSFLEAMGTRANPRGWDEAKQVLDGPLGKLGDVGAARFFLKALAAMTVTKRGRE